MTGMESIKFLIDFHTELIKKRIVLDMTFYNWNHLISPCNLSQVIFFIIT